MESKEFEFNGSKYKAYSRVILSEDGDERETVIVNATDESLVYCQRETMTMDAMIQEFIDDRDGMGQYQDFEEPTPDDCNCIQCHKPHGGDPLTTTFCSPACSAEWDRIGREECPDDYPEETPSLEQPWWRTEK